MEGSAGPYFTESLTQPPPPVKEKKKVSLFATVMEHLKLIGDYGGN